MSKCLNKYNHNSVPSALRYLYQQITVQHGSVIML